MFRTFFLISTLAQIVPAQINVLTANYGNDRSNANLQETKLTPDSVAPGRFGLLAAFPVDGQVYAQPLYASSITIPGLGTHNVIFLATQHNSVYAYDADALQPPQLLWHVNLGPSVPSSLFPDYHDVKPEIGILGTGAIDPSRGVLYVVSMELLGGSPQFHLHALDLGTGQESLNGPVLIHASVPGSGAGSSLDGTLAFDPAWQLQRPGLLLANGAVYLSFGSHGDQWHWHGWILAYSESDLRQQLGVFSSTPNGLGGSIWQSGRGLAADDNGNMYAVTGNGDYDGTSNFSQSFLKLSGAAPKLVDWFTPFNWQTLTEQDQDLSAGPVLLAGTHLVIGGDKAGQVYLINGDAMGELGAANAGTVQITQATGSEIFELAVWNRPSGAYLYVREAAGPLKCFSMAGGTLNPIPVSVSDAMADTANGGMALSADGGQDASGILWETTVNRADPARPGTLHAFNASDLSRELWNSDMSGGPDALGAFAKFARPTVANGKVYVATFSNRVVVYGPTGVAPLAVNTGN